MGRRKLPAHKELKHIVCTRVDEEKYQELMNILSYPPHYGMSDLLRRIIENRRIKIFTSAPAHDPILDKLKEIREKIKQTGITINQYTRTSIPTQRCRQRNFMQSWLLSNMLRWVNKLNVCWKSWDRWQIGSWQGIPRKRATSYKFRSSWRTPYRFGTQCVPNLNCRPALPMQPLPGSRRTKPSFQSSFGALRRVYHCPSAIP